MRKKIIIISASIAGFVVLCAGGFAGWFFYQMRDMHHIETAQISDSIFTIKGTMSNMYLVKTKDGFIAFDAGDNPEKIAKGCKTLSIDPSSVSAVFLTHSDADHVNGLTVFSSARVYLSQDEVPLLKEKKYRHFLGIEHKNHLPVSKYETISDGDSLEIGGIVIHAIATTGHTLGSMSFRVDNAVFTGDLCIIVDGKVRPMVAIFTEDMAVDSMSIRKIAGMSDINQIYTAHSGYTTNFKDAVDKWR
jgi:hydroxyacylglutathione hydrolase